MIRRDILVHAVAEDGLPDMDRLTGRVAFIWDGAVISGWPLGPEHGYSLEEGVWEGSENRIIGPFGGVTHWIEFDVPAWSLSSVSTA